MRTFAIGKKRKTHGMPPKKTADQLFALAKGHRLNKDGTMRVALLKAFAKGNSSYAPAAQAALKQRHCASSKEKKNRKK
jgi:hypothetical protein